MLKKALLLTLVLVVLSVGVGACVAMASSASLDNPGIYKNMQFLVITNNTVIVVRSFNQFIGGFNPSSPECLVLINLRDDNKLMIKGDYQVIFLPKDADVKKAIFHYNLEKLQIIE